jgi:2-phosphosulfolactate phosphatase
MKLHVLTRKEELDDHRLPGKVVVVIDVLFATTSIAAVLAAGAAEVIPALDGEAARAVAAGRPPGSFLLAGELDAATLPGFSDPTPLALLQLPLRGRALVYSTTNGTVALGKAAGAARVYAAALVNGAAVVDHLVRTAQGETVLLVCSGSAAAFNLEDFYGAGHLVSHLARRVAGLELSDAALAALMLHDGAEPLPCLARGRVGRLMLARGLERELEYAARPDRLAVVPELVGGRLRAAT